MRGSWQVDVPCKRRFHVINDTQAFRQNAVDIHQCVLAPVQARASLYRGFVTAPQHARNQPRQARVFRIHPKIKSEIFGQQVFGC